MFDIWDDGGGVVDDEICRPNDEIRVNVSLAAKESSHSDSLISTCELPANKRDVEGKRLGPSSWDEARLWVSWTVVETSGGVDASSNELVEAIGFKSVYLVEGNVSCRNISKCERMEDW